MRLNPARILSPSSHSSIPSPEMWVSTYRLTADAIPMSKLSSISLNYVVFNTPQNFICSYRSDALVLASPVSILVARCAGYISHDGVAVLVPAATKLWTDGSEDGERRGIAR